MGLDISKYEEDLQVLKNFRLLDDDFMTVVFDDNKEATGLILNIILCRTDLVVTEVVGQREIKNPNGRSVRLDIHAKDDAGKSYDIEIQRTDSGASAQRARFNSSMMDTRLLKPGDGFEQLTEAYVIFITENDVIGAELPMYHIDRLIQETDTLFGDGSHIIYVNGAYDEETDNVGKLMHDFRCTDASDMHYNILAERVRYFKETEGGREDMCKAMEDLCSRRAAEAVRNSRVETALAMLRDGVDYQTISKYSGLSIREVEELAEKKSA